MNQPELPSTAPATDDDTISTFKQPPQPPRANDASTSQPDAGKSSLRNHTTTTSAVTTTVPDNSPLPSPPSDVRTNVIATPTITTTSAATTTSTTKAPSPTDTALTRPPQFTLENQIPREKRVGGEGGEGGEGEEPSKLSSMPPLPVNPPISSSQPIPSLSITLLLISGARHHFFIDSNYLTRHSITASENDALNLSVITLKECIWKDWREEEWDQRPPSAHFIRLIHFGRLLDDRQQLRDCKMNLDTPNVVHMTVRPADVGDDDITNRSAKLPYGRDGGQGEGRSPTCRCVIL